MIWLINLFILYSVWLHFDVLAGGPPVQSPNPTRQPTTAVPTIYIPYDTQIIQESSCIGLNGTCSPVWCKNVQNSACTNPHYGQKVDTAAYLKTIPCKLCKQSTKPICSTESLTNLTNSLSGGIGGLKAIFCNDKFLIIHSTGSPNHQVGLKYIPEPPGEAGVPYSEACVTRSFAETNCTYKIPLYPQLLPEANASNNAAAFIGQTNPAAIPGYGLPDSGNSAVSITGVNMFPVFNNEGTISNERCEVDKCNAHAGQGFDYHYHGDPFSWDNGTCLYSPMDYVSNTTHPPLIGWALDGFAIYGRHLNKENLGYNVSLDICGGHIHNDSSGNEMEYHYHTQVQYRISDDTVSQPGEKYYAYIPGVFNCWRGNITVANFFTYIEEDYQPCCNGTEAFLTEGMVLNSQYLYPTQRPTIFNPTNPPKPGSPTNPPTASPSSSPSKLPTLTPTSSSKSPTLLPTVSPSYIPSLPPTISPSSSPTNSPSLSPSSNPTLKPTFNPTVVPTLKPTIIPTTLPTLKPSSTPSVAPTLLPSPKPSKVGESNPPTAYPSSFAPTVSPTSAPTFCPSSLPSFEPTVAPTTLPTFAPSYLPTFSPSFEPSSSPSFSPSSLPSFNPTYQGTADPTVLPSNSPTSKPTLSPSSIPSYKPTITPTLHPSTGPTISPTTSKPTHHKPTHKPTIAYKYSPFLATVNINITQDISSYYNASIFLTNSTNSDDFLQVVSTILDLNSSTTDIYITSVIDSSTSSRMRMLSTQTVSISYVISYQYRNQTDLNLAQNTLGNTVENILSTNVNNGNFQSMLLSTSSSILQQVTSVSPPVVTTNTAPVYIYTYQPTYSPTSLSKASKGFSMYIIIAAAGGGGLLLIVLVLFFYLNNKGPAKTAQKYDSIEGRKSLELKPRNSIIELGVSDVQPESIIVPSPRKSSTGVILPRKSSADIPRKSSADIKASNRKSVSPRKSKAIPVNEDVELQYDYPVNGLGLNPKKESEDSPRSETSTNQGDSPSPKPRNKSIAMSFNAEGSAKQSLQKKTIRRSKVPTNSGNPEQKL